MGKQLPITLTAAQSQSIVMLQNLTRYLSCSAIITSQPDHVAGLACTSSPPSSSIQRRMNDCMQRNTQSCVSRSASVSFVTPSGAVCHSLQLRDLFAVVCGEHCSVSITAVISLSRCSSWLKLLIRRLLVCGMCNEVSIYGCRER